LFKIELFLLIKLKNDERTSLKKIILMLIIVVKKKKKKKNALTEIIAIY
jgi:hypothetical protein